MNDESTLPISLTTLAELNVIGINHPFDLSHLSYLQTQQVLTLYSLLQYFEDHGLQAPFHLDIQGLNGKPKENSRP